MPNGDETTRCRCIRGATGVEMGMHACAQAMQAAEQAAQAAAARAQAASEMMQQKQQVAEQPAMGVLRLLFVV